MFILTNILLPVVIALLLDLYKRQSVEKKNVILIVLFSISVIVMILLITATYKNSSEPAINNIFKTV